MTKTGNDYIKDIQEAYDLAVVSLKQYNYATKAGMPGAGEYFARFVTAKHALNDAIQRLCTSLIEIRLEKYGEPK